MHHQFHLSILVSKASAMLVLLFSFLHLLTLAPGTLFRVMSTSLELAGGLADIEPWTFSQEMDSFFKSFIGVLTVEYIHTTHCSSVVTADQS